nr:zinc finger, FYVE/PHD-type [Tanacetum cinerariifolium]
MGVIVDRGVLDYCQHWFCFSCINNWASITNLCPLCQNEFQLIICVPCLKKNGYAVLSKVNTAYKVGFFGLDTAYGSKGILRIGNWSNVFSCKELALICRIRLTGYGVYDTIRGVQPDDGSARDDDDDEDWSVEGDNNTLSFPSYYIDENVKDKQEKDKIGSKPDKNEKRGEAGKSQKQLQSRKKEKLKKLQVEWPKMQTPTKLLNKEVKIGTVFAIKPKY